MNPLKIAILTLMLGEPASSENKNYCFEGGIKGEYLEMLGEGCTRGVYRSALCSNTTSKPCTPEAFQLAVRKRDGDRVLYAFDENMKFLGKFSAGLNNFFPYIDFSSSKQEAEKYLQAIKNASDDVPE